MEILPYDILTYPNPILDEPARPVLNVSDEKIQWVIKKMWVTLDRAEGIGLAAPQVGIGLRIFLVKARGLRQAFINPKVTPLGDERVKSPEGCLSFPGKVCVVPRHSEIEVEAMNEEGARFSVNLGGLHAIVVQHEFDHLEGVVITDYPQD